MTRKECKLCGESFGEKEAIEWADVLQHYAEEHDDSDELRRVMDGVTVAITCCDCGDSFEAEVEFWRAGVFSPPAYCEACRAKDRIRSIIGRQLSAGDVMTYETGSALST